MKTTTVEKGQTIAHGHHVTHGLFLYSLRAKDRFYIFFFNPSPTPLDFTFL